jgi:hypothetical protein
MRRLTLPNQLVKDAVAKIPEAVLLSTPDDLPCFRP